MKLNLTDNLTLKIISVVMGLVLYLFVMQEREDERVVKYSVLVSEPEGYMLMSDVPEVSVVVMGRNRYLRSLDEEQTISVAFPRAVTHKTFEPDDFPLSSGLEVRSITPQTITLDFSRVITREVPISLNYTGSPAPGYSVTATTVSPSTIRVEGPESAMQGLVGVFTQSINLEGLDEGTQQRVNLVSPGGRITFDTSVPVWVSIEIEQDEATIAVDTIPVTISGPGERFAVDRETVSAVLHGPRSALERIDSTQLSASVDAMPFASEPPGTYDVRPVIINLPAGLWADNISPSTLRLTVEQLPALQHVTVPFINLLPFPLPSRLVLPQPTGPPVVDVGG